MGDEVVYFGFGKVYEFVDVVYVGVGVVGVEVGYVLFGVVEEGVEELVKVGEEEVKSVNVSEYLGLG